jgi:hypothetical protein
VSNLINKYEHLAQKKYSLIKADEKNISTGGDKL